MRGGERADDLPGFAHAHARVSLAVSFRSGPVSGGVADPVSVHEPVASANPNPNPNPRSNTNTNTYTYTVRHRIPRALREARGV